MLMIKNTRSRDFPGSPVVKTPRFPFAATCMDLEIILPSEISQREKDKYHDIT